MTRIVVVDDHVLVRQSVVKTIAAEPGFIVVGEASDGEEAVRVVGETRPELVVMDIGLPGPDGIEVAGRLAKLYPAIRVMFLTMHDDESSIRRAVAFGVDGFVPKTASTDELRTALRVIAGGESYLSPSIARRVMDFARGRKAGSANLTDRELEILSLMARGVHPNDVAGRLYVSVKTVKNHLTSVYTKLGVRNGAQAVAAAYRQGLVAAE